MYFLFFIFLWIPILYNVYSSSVILSKPHADVSCYDDVCTFYLKEYKKYVHIKHRKRYYMYIDYEVTIADTCEELLLKKWDRNIYCDVNEFWHNTIIGYRYDI